jgi:hypothetical protein
MMMSRIAITVVGALAFAGAVSAYPIDGYEDTGITRLEAYRLAQDGELPGVILYYGAQLNLEEVTLRLTDHQDLSIPEPDPVFTQEVVSLLGEHSARYGVAVLDLSDPGKPALAVHNPDQLQNPGSVGKMMIALAWFQAMKEILPDVVDRRALLKNTQVTATDWIVRDSHTVPVFNIGDPGYEKRPIHIGDTGNLYTWMDWMLSSSSNAAGAQLQRELVLFRHFGKAYPVPEEQAQEWLAKTPKAELSKIFLDAMIRPLRENGLDPARLRQGSFFTRTGKGRIPGTSSHGSAAAFLQYMFLVEQGKLVDPWSSLEIKRLLYLTDKRIRYASSPVLWEYAIYFKSGSWYGCRPEKGFQCRKYHGNVRNFMNSVTMVESVDQKQKLHYIAVVLSNVLKVDSLEDHKRMGTEVHQLIQARHPVEEDATGAATEWKPDVEGTQGRGEKVEPAPVVEERLPWLEPAAEDVPRVAPPPESAAPPEGGYAIESSPGALIPSSASPPPDDGASSSQR